MADEYTVLLVTLTLLWYLYMVASLLVFTSYIFLLTYPVPRTLLENCFAFFWLYLHYYPRLSEQLLGVISFKWLHVFRYHGYVKRRRRNHCFT